MPDVVVLTDPVRNRVLEIDQQPTVTDAGDGRWTARWSTAPGVPVRVRTDAGAFAFWVDEVSAESPIFLPALDLVVTAADDTRSYAEVAGGVRRRGLATTLATYATEAEDSYPAAAERNRQLQGPAWLGLGRDLRTFGVGLRSVGAGSLDERLWDWVAPQWNGEAVTPPGQEAPVRYQFMIGRGISAQHAVSRRLREGRLPVLDAEIEDGAITYRATALVALERSPLTADSNRGTPFLVADGHSAGHMFTPEQQQEFDTQQARWEPDEETVLYLRVVATNTAAVPRHAFVTAPLPGVGGQHVALEHRHDPRTGILGYGPDAAFATVTVDGEPSSQPELSILLGPGRQTVIDVRIPHRPITDDRATALRDRAFSVVEGETVRYWQDRLASAARIRLPETRLTEMIDAGLLHLDLITFGTEPDGTLAPTIGVYAPIGSESAPIMQFYDAMGWTDVAERSLQYFIDKQHDDGFVQNFGGYMLETEAILWSLGEHFRYTRDLDWVKRIRPGLEAAVGYILRNRETQRAGGLDPHGLLVGKTADPEDPFASYMLNGFACLGLSRAAEMIMALDPEQADVWASEARALRDDLRSSLAEAMAGSPVVPLGDGSWSRTAPPWAGHPGPLTIDRSPRRWFTHGTITARDALLGPLWLVAQEVLDPADPVTTELLEYHVDLLFHDNAAFSQPYYSPHLLTHLRRGEVGAFLRSYYTMVASLADPETYSFWEHYFHASPHKTHEEGWFLMQTRWMLWLEDGDTLRLLPGIPRRWLAAGETIELDGVRSYFGPVSLRVTADADRVEVRVRLDPDRRPDVVRIRLPHPDGPRSAQSTHGRYDAATETLELPADHADQPIVVTFDHPSSHPRARPTLPFPKSGRRRQRHAGGACRR